MKIKLRDFFKTIGASALALPGFVLSNTKPEPPLCLARLTEVEAVLRQHVFDVADERLRDQIAKELRISVDNVSVFPPDAEQCARVNVTFRDEHSSWDFKGQQVVLLCMVQEDWL